VTALESLQEYCRESDRVCPVPTRWKELWEMLLDRARSISASEPPAPLILGAWSVTSNLDKRIRLDEHLRWADDQGALDEVDSFLRALPESDWHHLGD